MAPKFEIFNDAHGGFRFRLKAMNGEVVAESHSYTTKQGAQHGIKSVKANAPDATLADYTG